MALPTGRRQPPCAHAAVTFSIYDLDGSGRISKANMAALLQSLLGEHDVTIPDAQVAALVERTFATEDANRDG